MGSPLCVLMGALFLLAPAAAGAMPEAFRLLWPPLRPRATLWLEAEDAGSNIGIQAKEDTYGGKHRVLFTPAPPGPEGYFIRFSVVVPAERAGRFRLFGACGPVGEAFVSPTALVVDGKPLRRIERAPAGVRAWGVSHAVRWVDLGEVELTPGRHTLECVVREPRAMDKSYAQEFDAMALVHENDALFPAAFSLSEAPVLPAVRAGGRLHVSARLTVLTSALREPADTVAVLRLLRNGGVVSEAPLPVRVAPDSAGKATPIAADLDVPFDAPSGAYEVAVGGLCGKDGRPALLPAGTVEVQGRFPAPAGRPPRLRAPRVEAPAAATDRLSGSAGQPGARQDETSSLKYSAGYPGLAKAGGSWTFRVSIACAADLADPPRRMVVRLERGPHLCYLAQAFAVKPAPAGWRKGARVLLGPFSMRLPADLPAGTYAVQVALVGEAWAGRKPDNLSAGSLRVSGAATAETTSLRPLAYGTFVDSLGVPHAWHSTPSHALVWDGEPFLPISGMLNGPYMSWAKGPAEFEKFQANIQAIRAHGLDHVYLFTQGSMEALPPHCWEFLMDALDRQGMTYVIGYPGGSPGTDVSLDARPIRARPEMALAVPNAALPGQVSRKLTAGELGAPPRAVVSCLALAVDGAGRVFGPVDAVLGSAHDDSVDVTASFPEAPAGRCRVLFLPRVHTSFVMANPWAKWEEQVEKVAAYLSRIRFRPGFRGFIDMVLPNERGIYNEAESLFVEDPAFLADRARWLSQRHRTPDALAAAWALREDPPARFEVAARLFPALSEAGVLLLVDPVERRVYRADAARSLFWYEYLEHRDESYARCQNRICDAIRARVDVPITIKRCGVTERYHANPNRADRGLDGAGYEIYAAGDNLSPYGAGPGYAEMLQARKCMIGAATEFNRAFAEDGPANWPDVASFFYDLAVAQHLCAKSTYLFLFDVLPYNYLTRNRLIEDSRILEWMGIWKRLLDARRDAVAAYTPLVYTSWPPGDSWWARPSERRAVRETDDAPGTITAKAPNGVWVLPVWDPEAPAPLTVVTLADDPAVRAYAAAFERLLLRRDRTVVFLGVRRNLGALSIDRYFTPETFEVEGDICQVLTPAPGAKVLERDAQGRVWALQQGNLQIVARRPKKPGALDASLRWLHCPPAPDDARASARGFLEQVMGVKPLSVADGRFLGVSFTEKGQPVAFLHSTSREGGETLDLLVPDGKRVRAAIPALGADPVDAAGGTRLALRFPPGPGSDGRKGAGADGVTLVGLRPEELRFAFAGAAVPARVGAAASGRSAVPAGCVLPPAVAPEIAAPANIDEAKAAAALGKAVDSFREGNLPDAERLGREWIGLATRRLLPAFCLLMGHVRLGLGDAGEARGFYQRGLAAAPEDAGLHCALGVALLALGDRDGARRAWERARGDAGPAGEAARRNLEGLGG